MQSIDERVHNFERGPKKQEAIELLATGLSKTAVAERLQVSRQTMGQFANREDIKEAIEKEQLKLLDSLPDAVDYVKSLVPQKKRNGKYKKMDKHDKELSYKASSDIMKTMGVFPSNIPSQIVTNIYNDRTLINPIIMQLLDQREKEFRKFELEMEGERE